MPSDPPRQTLESSAPAEQPPFTAGASAADANPFAGPNPYAGPYSSDAKHAAASSVGAAGGSVPAAPFTGANAYAPPAPFGGMPAPGLRPAAAASPAQVSSGAAAPPAPTTVRRLVGSQGFELGLALALVVATLLPWIEITASQVVVLDAHGNPANWWDRTWWGLSGLGVTSTAEPVIALLLVLGYFASFRLRRPLGGLVSVSLAVLVALWTGVQITLGSDRAASDVINLSLGAYIFVLVGAVAVLNASNDVRNRHGTSQSPA